MGEIAANSGASGEGGSCVLHARAGLHAWEGDLLVQVSNSNVTSDIKAVLEGTWLLKEKSSGTFDLLTCQHKAIDVADSCVLVWGGPWLFDDCSIRSNGGLAMECSKSCAVMLRRCKVGGIDASRIAGGGVSVGGDGRCLLEKCKLQHIAALAADGADGLGAALCAMGNGKLSLEQSTIQDCGCCVVVYDRSRVIVRSSKLMAASSAAFQVHEGCDKAALLLQKTQVLCSKLWCDERRPGRFESRDCKFSQ